MSLFNFKSDSKSTTPTVRVNIQNSDAICTAHGYHKDSCYLCLKETDKPNQFQSLDGLGTMNAQSIDLDKQ